MGQMTSLQTCTRVAVALAVGVGVGQPALAVDGVSVTTHWQGAVDWTIGGFGSIWRHDIIDSQVVCRRRLHDGPARMVVINTAGEQIAFIKHGTGRVTVMPIGGGPAREVATAHEDATLDWPSHESLYYNLGSWYSASGSRSLYRVDIATDVSELVVQWEHGIWRFHIANDEVRAVARPTSGPAGNTIVTYDLPGDGTFDPARAGDSGPSCSTALDPLGQYYVDGMHGHQGFDIRDWANPGTIVKSFIHAEAVAWGGPDSGPHHIRNGWSTNSQDWICAHLGWDISPYVNLPRGGNQVLYNWKTGSEERIVVTPNQEYSYAYDSAGDFWVGSPPIPPSLGIRAYWLFDAPDVTTDATGLHTLTNRGVVAGVGRINGAAELAAAEQDELRIPDAALADGMPFKLENGRPEFTIAGWLRKNRAGQREYLLQKGSFSPTRLSFGLYIEPGSGGGLDSLCAQLARYPHNSPDPAEQATSYCWPDAVAEDLWYFFAVTVDAGRSLRLRLWDDAAGAWLAPDPTWTLAEPLIFTDGDLVIGCGEWDGTRTCFDGSLDDLRIFDHSMTAAEIGALVAPPACTTQGFVCCDSGSICSDIQNGGGCAPGAACCAAMAACAPLACGDGLCSAGETCTEDLCCSGQVYDGVTTVCCAGLHTSGECCQDTDCMAPALCTAHQCVAPPASPRAHWQLNGGALIVDSAGSNTLTNNGAAEIAGRRGGAAAFASAEQDVMRIPDADLDAGMPLKSQGGTAELTLLGWFLRGRTGQLEYLVQKGGWTEQKLSFGIYVGGAGDQLCVEAGQSPGQSSEEICAGPALSSQRWYFFAVTLTASGLLRIHIWDDLISAWLTNSAGALSMPLNLEDGELHLGHGERQGRDLWLDGILDEMRIYDLVLTLGQIEEIRARDASGANLAPVVDAGVDQTDAGQSAVLGADATVSDANGDVISLSWRMLSGPAPAEIATPTEQVTTVTFAAVGQYVFQLTADDGLLQSSDDLTVFVVGLPTITLTSPAGGEVWTAGEVRHIEWMASGISDVALRYSIDNGATWAVIAPTVDDRSTEWQRYPWTIPNEPSTACMVRLEGYFDATNAAVSGAFEIRAPDSDPPTPERRTSCSTARPGLLPVCCILLAVARRPARCTTLKRPDGNT